TSLPEHPADLSPVQCALSVGPRSWATHVAHGVRSGPAPFTASVLERSRQDGHIARYGRRFYLAESFIAPLPEALRRQRSERQRHEARIVPQDCVDARTLDPRPTLRGRYLVAISSEHIGERACTLWARGLLVLD